MTVQFISTDPELIPGFYVEFDGDLVGPFQDEEGAEDYMAWEGIGD